MNLPDDIKEALTDATVDVLLAIRGAYLAAGASPLKHWDQLYDRMTVATRTTTGPEEWVTALLNGLKLGAPDRRTTDAVTALAERVRTCAGRAGQPAREGGPILDTRVGVRGWFAMLDVESHYILARTRKAAEEARDARAALAAGTSPAPTDDTATPVSEAL